MMPEKYVKLSMEQIFLMPFEIINRIEELNDSRKNDKIILGLLNEHGTAICNASSHREFFKSIEWEVIGSDCEIEFYNYCLGCGGMIE